MLKFGPIFFALLVLVAFGPELSWRRGDLKAVWHSLYPALGLAAGAGVVVLAIASPRSLTAAGAFAAAGWLIGAAILDIRKRRGARASAFAAALAHAGLGITLLGVTGTTVWRSEALTVVAPGQTMTVGPYTLRFDGVTRVKGPNYIADRGKFVIMDGGKAGATMLPGHRLYLALGQDVTDTAIRA